MFRPLSPPECQACFKNVFINSALIQSVVFYNLALLCTLNLLRWHCFEERVQYIYRIARFYGYVLHVFLMIVATQANDFQLFKIQWQCFIQHHQDPNPLHQSQMSLLSSLVNILLYLQYLGDWYEIRKFFFFIEGAETCIKANYSLKEDGHIRVYNKGLL